MNSENQFNPYFLNKSKIRIKEDLPPGTIAERPALRSQREMASMPRVIRPRMSLWTLAVPPKINGPMMSR